MQKKDIFLTLILMLLSGLAGIFVYQSFFSQDSYEPQPEKITQDINNIDLRALTARNFSDEIVNLSDYEGKHLIINFWATWCPPCRKEIPLLKDIQDKYRAQQVQVLGIAMDDKEKVLEYMQVMDFNYPNLLSDLSQTTQLSHQLNYQFIALPFTFFITKEGQLVHTETGELTIEELEQYTQALLKQTN